MRKMFLFTFIVLISSHALYAQNKNPKVIYKYKKFEKFDFDDLEIAAEKESPGDVSISPRWANKFKNKLPFRTNFDGQIYRSVEKIQ